MHFSQKPKYPHADRRLMKKKIELSGLSVRSHIHYILAASLPIIRRLSLSAAKEEKKIIAIVHI